MDKFDEKQLFLSLNTCFANLEEIYKLANMISKYCDLKKDSDDLYEVSELAKFITKISNETSLDLYRLIKLDPEMQAKLSETTIRDIFIK